MQTLTKNHPDTIRDVLVIRVREIIKQSDNVSIVDLVSATIYSAHRMSVDHKTFAVY